jgi:hypothetical protein
MKTLRNAFQTCRTTTRFPETSITSMELPWGIYGPSLITSTKRPEIWALPAGRRTVDATPDWPTSDRPKSVDAWSAPPM